jgi:hypothetical protein
MRKVLAALLVVWEPLTLAVTAAAFLDRLGDRGWGAIALLVVRLGITGFGVAAGRALWAGRPEAVVLTRWATGLNLAANVVTLTTSLWPSLYAPGVRGPVITVTIAWYTLWFLWALRQK